MGDNALVQTPNTRRYELRARTPKTPNTPGSATPTRALRSSSTPITGEHVLRDTPLNSSNTTPSRQKIPRTPNSKNARDGLVFKTPMSFKPNLVGNKPVPSPSRQEMWKQELGLEDDGASDKENTSSEEDDGQKCVTSQVEYRALQKVLAEKSAQRDETLLQLKNFKDKIRHYKSRLEREENTKRQQLKILKKTHETHTQEKDRLIDNLQAIVNEQEERIKELEDTTVSTPRKRTRQTKNSSQPSHSPLESVSKLIEDVRRLQEEKSFLTNQLNDVQLALDTLREDSSREVMGLKEVIVQYENGGGASDRVPNLKNRNLRSEDVVPYRTDTEKQVEVLQAENDRLLNELTEAKNAQSKAVTMSKLASHRHQQLEDEVKRLRQKNTELEENLKQKTTEYSDAPRVTDLPENSQLQSRVRDLQAEIFALRAKSPEVVKVTEVKQVESSALRKQYEASKSEIQQLKTDGERRKQELQDSQAQVRCLERLLSMAQSDKDQTEASLWKELNALNTEHQESLKSLRERLDQEKQSEIQMLENRLLLEQKKDLHNLVEAQAEKHKAELTRLEMTYNSFKTDLETQLSEMEGEKSKLLFQIEDSKCLLQKEMTENVEKLELEKERLEKKHQLELKQCEEDLQIAKTAALTQQREDLLREKDISLRELEQTLLAEHKEEITRMKAAFLVDLEEAILIERKTTAERMQTLETKFEQLVGQLRALQPILSGFVESYILLQKEVTSFPKIIRKTVNNVKKEVASAILGVSEYNKELVQKYQKEMKLRKKFHNELVELKGNIRVFCRVRPTIKEDGSGQQAEDIVALDQDDDGVLYVNSKGRTQSFEVDKVFGERSSQQQVFDEVKALVTSCIDGYNVCIFAYGQTGSGKTYTMEGTTEDPGINQRALRELFEETASRVDWDFTITVSVIEIYNEMIRDLLGDDTSYKMEVKINPDGGYHIPGLCYVTVQSVADVNECFRIGQQNRATAATNMNEHSSRSHALLCVTVIGFNKTTAAKTTGKLNLVDLAGSERVSKSKADGARLKEAQCINKSLSALGDVIFALRSKQSFIPYRNSKLTYLLQDSLGGDSKTLMITQIAPVRKNEGETICSLNFAQRVRNVELGAASRKMENGDGTENEPMSPSRTYSTPQRVTTASKSSTPTVKLNFASAMALKSGTPSPSMLAKSNTPLNMMNRVGTPSSGSKLTPSGRPNRKK